MAREICIKTPSGMYCKASPIKDCSCERDAGFEDPFSEVPEGMRTADSLVADVESVLKSATRITDPEEFAERLRVLATITRLVMLPEVRIKEPFLIMSLDLGVPTGSTAN